MAERVSVFELALRDGLQNEPLPVPFAEKLRLARGLLAAGVKDLELGAFVRPDRVPQMADTDRIYEAVKKRKLVLGKARAWALIPNAKGLERALAAGVSRVAIVTAASDTFNRANIGMSVAQSLKEFAGVMRTAKSAGLEVRGYVSTSFYCPYEGRVRASKALKVIESLAKLGVFQVSIGDTIGRAAPGEVESLLRPAIRALGASKLAVHFHDTRGTALANALRSLDLGIRTVDSSAGGLGGCPYAPGATGNLATEDLIHMLNGMGVATGIDLLKLARASAAFSKRIRRPVSSRYLAAYIASSLRR